MQSKYYLTVLLKKTKEEVLMIVGEDRNLVNTIVNRKKNGLNTFTGGGPNERCS